MSNKQDELPALRLLLAQGKLYSRAKRWSFLRWIGFSTIGVAAPILAVITPNASVGVGALAGVWIFYSTPMPTCGSQLRCCGPEQQCSSAIARTSSVKEFCQGLVTDEAPFVLGIFPQRGVVRLNRIGGMNHLADLWAKAGVMTQSSLA